MANENPIARKIVKGQRIEGPVVGSDLQGSIFESIPLNVESLFEAGQEEAQALAAIRSAFEADVAEARGLVSQLRVELSRRSRLPFRQRVSNAVEEGGLLVAAIVNSVGRTLGASLNELLSDLQGLLRAGLLPPIGPGESRYTSQRYNI